MEGARNSNVIVLNIGSNEPSVTMIKEEDINHEDVMLYTSPGMQYQQIGRNYNIVEAFGNTVSIPENSAYSIPFSEEQMNQILLSGSTDDPYAKMPIDLSQLFKLNEVKTEQAMSSQHVIKFKPDENGKHIKVWECAICHKEFGHQYILMRHLPTHTDERKFQCKQCGKAFRQMSTLSQHRAIHSKLRPYVCEVCQKTFNRVSTLISHRKTHTGLKPHRCHLCNKAFHQKGNLRNHIFTHTNERPYKCDVCQKGFNQMSNLMCHKFKAHQRADKPKYNCQTCGKEFDKRIGLRNHEQYEHGDQTVASTTVSSPSVKYTNGVLVSPINTAAMRHAIATNQVPFALLRPSNGIPVLVRVLPAGDKQMLVPATAEDLKKFGDISIKSKEEEDDEDEDEDKKDKENLSPEHNYIKATADASDNTAIISGSTSLETKGGATVQIRIPVVASVVQRCRDGTMHMDIESPGPKRDGQDDSFIFTTTDEEFNKESDPWETEVKSEIEMVATSNFNQSPILESMHQEDSEISIAPSDLQFYSVDPDGSKPQNYSMNCPELPMFDDVLNLSTPIINLDDEPNSIMISDIFVDGAGPPVYEIVGTQPPGNNIRVYENSQEDFDDIQVD